MQTTPVCEQTCGNGGKLLPLYGTRFHIETKDLISYFISINSHVQAIARVLIHVLVQATGREMTAEHQCVNKIVPMVDIA